MFIVIVRVNLNRKCSNRPKPKMLNLRHLVFRRLGQKSAAVVELIDGRWHRRHFSVFVRKSKFVRKDLELWSKSEFLAKDLKEFR